MRLRPTRSTNLVSGDDLNQDRQEVPEHPDCDDHEMEEQKESPSGANEQKEEDKVEIVLLAWWMTATESPPLNIIKEMEEMFLRLAFSQTVSIKLVVDQGIDSPWTLASLSDEDIVIVCNVSKRTGGLAGSKMPDWENQISILAAKNLKLAAFMFKLMEHCSKACDIKHVNSKTVL